jgi:hypothetical protein
MRMSNTRLTVMVNLRLRERKEGTMATKKKGGKKGGKK